MQAVAVEKKLRDRIVEATLVSLHDRDLYSEQTVARVLDSLQRAEKDVKASLLYYANLGSLPEGKAINQASLKKLQRQIGEHVRAVRDEHALIMKTAVKESYRSGIHSGIGDLVRAEMPFYRDLTPDGIRQCGSNIFTLIDKDALDFMANYNVQLAGDVSRELTDGINRAIQTGIASGRSVPEIARDIGRVVKDPEEFRKAGKTVFKTAQHRMQLIARTETMRAHNQGQLKFYETVGVKKVAWLAVGDERSCFPPVVSVSLGWGETQISDVNTGDFVITHDSARGRVSAVARRAYFGPGQHIITKNQELMATENHPIFVLRSGEFIVVNARDVVAGDFLLRKSE